METTLYKLKNCNLCESAKQRLLELGIHFTEIECTDTHNEKICDNIEKIVKTYNYPIISMSRDGMITYKCIDHEVTLKSITESGDKKIIKYTNIAGLLINILE